MPKISLKLFLFVVVSVFLVGCAAQKPMFQDWKTPFTAQNLNPGVQSGEYVKKIDNFLVILDSSGSMAQAYKGSKKLNLAKNIVSRMNQTIPDIDVQGGLRIFGDRGTSLIYGMTKYTTQGLSGPLNTVVQAVGDSPLAASLNAANKDLRGYLGGIAVIVVSDGDEDDMNYAAAIKAATSLKDNFGNRLCIYPILVGNDPKGKKLLDQIAKIGGCGFAVNADDIASSGAMANFYVKKVFLKHNMDSDGDGVYDNMDKCPRTPKGVKVDAKGCCIDSDGDGVCNYLDKCPGTPRGAKVDAKGCCLDADGDGVCDSLDRCPKTPIDARGVDAQGCWNIENILFDTDKSNIKARYIPILDEIVFILLRNPGLKMGIQGHTDSMASAKYNRGLSDRRAKSVMKYFIKKGIAKSRLSIIGYGLTQPTASNLTKEGRAKNRRAVMNPAW